MFYSSLINNVLIMEVLTLLTLNVSSLINFFLETMYVCVVFYQVKV